MPIMRLIVPSMMRHTSICLLRKLPMRLEVVQCATNSTDLPHDAVRISLRMMNFSAKAIVFNSVMRFEVAITNSILLQLLITDNSISIAPNDKILEVTSTTQTFWPQADIRWQLVGLPNMGVSIWCIPKDHKAAAKTTSISHSEAQALSRIWTTLMELKPLEKSRTNSTRNCWLHKMTNLRLRVRWCKKPESK